MSGGPPVFEWSSPEGRNLARTILSNSTLPYDPHDYQLDGVCKLLDGIDLLAVIATGRGKTGYFTMYMLIQQALAANPALCEPPWTRTPKDPGMIIVYPTIGLEEEMAVAFERLKLKTLVINGRTLQDARRERKSLWDAAVSDYRMLLLSPELLTSSGFEGLLQNNAFQTRVCALGIDEVHLLNSWGAGFRKPFQQLGYFRARMRSGLALAAASASILVGQPMKNICDLLGLRSGQYHFLQRSNLRPELQLLFRPLSRGLGGWVFPDFLWVLEGRRKTVFFCKTIALSFRLWTFLRLHCRASDTPHIRIRMYNSLNWPSYNERTRELMRNDPRAQVIIATASFMVGVDLPNIEDVVLVQEPADADEWVQWGGRAGRDRGMVKDARVITYVTKKGPSTAEAVIKASDNRTGEPHGQSSKKTPAMDVSIAKVILAPCKVAAQNELYGNPSHDVPCTCRTCTIHPPPSLPSICNCSGCAPEELVMQPPPKKVDTNPVPRTKRISRAMRKRGEARLAEVREEIYRSLDKSPRSLALPPSVYLPEPVITLILDRCGILASLDDLKSLLNGRTYALQHVGTIWNAVQALNAEFEEVRAKEREDRRLKAAAKRAEVRAAGGMKPGDQHGVKGTEVDGDGDDEDVGDVEDEDEGRDGLGKGAAAPEVGPSTLHLSPEPQAFSMETFTVTNTSIPPGPARAQVVESTSGPGYATHILAFGDVVIPSQVSRKRTRGVSSDQAVKTPKRRRKSNKENIE